jgi:hypothetical protein
MRLAPASGHIARLPSPDMSGHRWRREVDSFSSSTNQLGHSASDLTRPLADWAIRSNIRGAAPIASETSSRGRPTSSAARLWTELREQPDSSVANLGVIEPVGFEVVLQLVQ